jgi:putative hydrolase of the HAD superfamily
LLFDAAGTLIEPAEPVAEVYARYFGGEGWEVPPAVIRAAFGEVFSRAPTPDYPPHGDGDPAERAWWREVVFGTLAACGIDPRAEEARAAACFEGLFRHYAAPAAWRVFPEVAGVLEDARRAGLATGVVSNFDRRLHGILDGHGLSFGFVLTSAEARARKPDAAIFRESLARLGMEPWEVRHAGDSPAADGGGARSAGIEPYLVERPARDLRGFLAEALAGRRK